MSDVLEIINFILNSLLNITMPWFNLKFGAMVLGPLFIGLLIGVFVNIFTSLNDDNGSSKHENGPRFRRNKSG